MMMIFGVQLIIYETKDEISTVYIICVYVPKQAFMYSVPQRISRAPAIISMLSCFNNELLLDYNKTVEYRLCH